MSIPTFHALIAAAGKPRRRDSFQVQHPILGSLSVIRYSYIPAGRRRGYCRCNRISSQRTGRHLARSGHLSPVMRTGKIPDRWPPRIGGLSGRVELPVLFAATSSLLPCPPCCFAESGAESAVPQINKKRTSSLIGANIQPFLLSWMQGTAVCVKPSASPYQRTLVEVPDEGVLFDANFPLTVPSFWNATENSLSSLVSLSLNGNCPS